VSSQSRKMSVCVGSAYCQKEDATDADVANRARASLPDHELRQPCNDGEAEQLAEAVAASRASVDVAARPASNNKFASEAMGSKAGRKVPRILKLLQQPVHAHHATR